MADRKSYTAALRSLIKADRRCRAWNISVTSRYDEIAVDCTSYDATESSEQMRAAVLQAVSTLHLPYPVGVYCNGLC